MKQILYYVSGHGFGHAVRSALVVRELYRLGFQCHIVTSAPKFIFQKNLSDTPFHYHYKESDIGVSQRGSLEIDLPATLRGWEACLAGEVEWMEDQLDLCREIKPAAVVSDIVPFAFPLARRAGLPSFLVTTFTWDWVLDFYKEDDPALGEIASRLAAYYLEAHSMIYTPLSFGLPPIKNRRFVSLMGKRSPFTREELVDKLDLDERPAFLVSFGGFGLRETEKMKLEEMTDFQFLFLSGKRERKGNVITFSGDEAAHEDLVAVSRAVITKPGYGISCEAILNRVPMIYTSRGKFAEYEPLVEEIARYIPTRYISQEELFSGGLRPCLEIPPEFSKDLLTDTGYGATGAGEAIMKSIG